MSKFALFNEIRESARRADSAISNLEVLGLAPDSRSIRILWMYPDVLNMHGGRGDAMALLHVSDLMALPCTIRRINALTEEIPFDWADMIFFQSGDLACMEDINRALEGKREAFRRFAEAGKLVLAIGSSGAILAEKTVYLDGRVSQGLGLLGMELRQRKTVHGDDLWFTTEEGLEVLASQIQTADVLLKEGQDALGQVTYGRGNCGDSREGARSGNVIFTHSLGPALTRNPFFTAWLLTLCAGTAGIQAGALREEDILLELGAMEDVRAFIQKKIHGEIHG